ncbi:MAG: hypothetical protein Q4G28_09535 [Neisseria sp.]|nr:hypothetical protein [Neisseria sp.]
MAENAGILMPSAALSSDCFIEFAQVTAMRNKGEWNTGRRDGMAGIGCFDYNAALDWKNVSHDAV